MLHSLRSWAMSKAPIAPALSLMLLLGTAAGAAWLPVPIRNSLLGRVQNPFSFARSAALPPITSVPVMVSVEDSLELPPLSPRARVITRSNARQAALSFTVTSTADFPDGKIGDGVCQTSTLNGANCTLRAAIQESNLASGGNAKINFTIPGSGVKTISLSQPLPDIVRPVDINGYSQPGSSVNTNVSGAINAVPLVQILGNGGSGNNLTFGAGSSLSSVRGLILSGAGDSGIELGSADNTVGGCFIGTNPNGTSAQGNSFSGVRIANFRSGASISNNTIGGSAADRNLISGNGDPPAILVSGDSAKAQIVGNLIGTDKSGAKALGNAGDGINLGVGTGIVNGNVVSGNARGIVVAPLSTLADTSQVFINDNLIGTNAAGTNAIPNKGAGLTLTEGESTGVQNASIGRNTISGNAGGGIVLSGEGTKSNSIYSNRIGIGAKSDVAIPNTGGAGIEIDAGANGNKIGDLDAKFGNIIANNVERGVLVTSRAGTGNSILGNSIYNNTNLGIDLGTDGISPNDPGDGDGGPNNTQNFPVIQGVFGDAVSTSLNSVGNGTFRIEYFASDSADPLGNGEGQVFLGAYPNAFTLAGGSSAGFTFTSPVPIQGRFVSATATRLDGTTPTDTSEFSKAVRDASGACSTVVSTTADSGSGSLRAAIDCANSNPDASTITFAASVSGTIDLTTTDDPDSSSSDSASAFLLTTPVTIQGPGARVLTLQINEVNGVSRRVLRVAPGVTASVIGLTFSGGNGEGMIFNSGTLSLNNCAFSDGKAAFTAGVLNSTLNKSNGGPSPTLAISGCSFSGNSGRGGAAVSNNVGAASISNSTFSGSTSESGGAVRNSGTMTLANCTFTSNSTASGDFAGQDVTNTPLTNPPATQPRLTVSNNIFNSALTRGHTIVSNSGTVTDEGYNLARDDGSGVLTASTDKLNTDPKLGPLQNNGGPTQTHALLVGSPALDAGQTDLTTDQRGVARPQGSADDIGAFEGQSGGGSGACSTVVINTNDSGNGSLRAAIDCSNTTAGTQTISFAVPGAGVKTIAPTSKLPDITAPVVVDGYTQPGAGVNPNATGALNTQLRVELSGANAGASDGLTLTSTATGSTIRGLVINRFRNGVVIGAAGSTLAGCFLGTDPAGTLDLGNREDGVFLFGVSDATVGGTTPAARNLISGNNVDGVDVGGSNSSRNTVQGNLIGTDISGTLDLGNGDDGIDLDSVGGGNTIGGGTPAARNVISGNGEDGVTLEGASVSNNTVQGNYLGTNAAGTAAISNAQTGINLVGAPSNSVVGNLISGNQFYGVFVTGAGGNRISGNRIGTDALGTAAIPNQNGVQLNNASQTTIGGTAAGAGNLISGNTFDGISIFGGGTIANPTGGDNVIQGNLIGLNAAGTAALGNGDDGVDINSSSRTEVGGTASGARNVIAANGDDGIEIDGGNDAASGADATGNIVQGNFIGTGASGNAALGNKDMGVSIEGASNNVIGGAGSGQGNLIAFNTGDGVSVNGTKAGNAISSNSIFGNGKLGIDLAASSDPANGVSANGVSANGVSPNDAGDTDSGPNDLQNYPVITSVTGHAILGTLNAAPTSTGESYRIELFSSATADPSGFGEGQQFLGFVSVRTDGSGNASWSFTSPVSMAGRSITSTATYISGATDIGAAELATNGDTSEFSLAVRADGAPTKLTTSTSLSSSLNPSQSGQNVTFTALVAASTTAAARAAAGVPTGNVSFNDGATSLGTAALSASGAATFSTSTLSAGTHSITAIYEGDANFNGSTAILNQVVNAGPTLPTLSISDVSLSEGNSGQKNATFSVSLSGVSGALATPISVQYATADGTATQPGDYLPSSGTLSFAASQKSLKITVAIVGDTARESNETFAVNLSNPSGATISDGQGVGTITNDDRAFDLQITQSAAPNPVPIGATLTFTLQVKNSGPDAAQNVVITDTLPANSAFLEAKGATFTRSGATVTFTLGTLNNGATRTLSVAVSAPDVAGTLVNSAKVSGSGAPDSAAANNQSATSVSVIAGPQNVSAQTDVTLSKLTNVGAYLPNLYHAGAHLVQTVTLRNRGAAVTGPLYLMLDDLPAGVELVNGSGATTLAPSGAVYISVPIGSDNLFSAGESARVRLEFRLKASVRPTFTPRVMAGAGTP